MTTKSKWVRSCNECGNEQVDKQPDPNKELTNAYRNRKCENCKSSGLDYGTLMSKEPNQSWEDYYANSNPEDLEHDDFVSDMNTPDDDREF